MKRTIVPPVRDRMWTIGRDAFKDSIAGVVASIVLIANIVSFGALMFPGALGDGIPIAIWAMLIGSCVGGVGIALRTSLPPLTIGIDSPTGAALVLLSAIIAPAVVAAGETPDAAVQVVMLVFTAATLVSGALFYCVGVFRWGTYCRFVPYFVVGGFLAATGWLLVVGGIRMATGIAPALEPAGPPWTWISTTAPRTAHHHAYDAGRDGLRAPLGSRCYRVVRRPSHAVYADSRRTCTDAPRTPRSRECIRQLHHAHARRSDGGGQSRGGGAGGVASAAYVRYETYRLNTITPVGDSSRLRS